MGRDKALISYQGETLLERAASVFHTLAEQVLISGDPDKYHLNDSETIPDEIPHIGALGGLHSCLKAAHYDEVLIVPCDMPFVVKELFDHLLTCRREESLTLPRSSEGKLQPLCGIYCRKVWKQIEEQISRKDYKVHHLLKGLTVQEVNIDKNLPFYTPRLLNNINTPKDLSLME